MRDFEMTRGTENVGKVKPLHGAGRSPIFLVRLILVSAHRFLSRCAHWIGEAPHLDLLETLLSLGFDATEIDSPHAQDWPMPCSPNWGTYDIAPDPFFVDYLSMLCRGNQGKSPRI